MSDFYRFTISHYKNDKWVAFAGRKKDGQHTFHENTKEELMQAIKKEMLENRQNVAVKARVRHNMWIMMYKNKK